MRNVALLVALIVAPPAWAGAPAVKENTGDLVYGYDFALPPARGRHQPALSLTYSSASRSDSGYGYGWQMSLAYIERETRVTPGTSSKTPGPYRLVFGSKSRTLVSVGVNLFRPDVETEYLSVAYAPGSDTSKFTATDGVGTSYEFEVVKVPGSSAWPPVRNRWYLTKVTDLLGNQTVYEYELEPSVETPQSASDYSSSALLIGIKYDLQAPGGNQFTHSVALEYVSDAPGSLEAVAGTMVSHRKHLSRVVVSGLGTVLRNYELGYATAPLGGHRVLMSVVEKGKNGALPQPATTFDYGFAGLSGYSLESPVVSAPPPVSCADANGDGLPDCRCQEWRDLDADGRADCLITSVAQGVGHYYYLRNVTPVGGAPLLFMPAVELAFSETNNNALKADFNGDGFPDSVRGSPTCFSGQGLLVQVGRRTANWSPTEGGFELGPAFCIDARGPFQQWKAWYPSGGTCQGNGASAYLVLSDVNGDGVLDYSVMEPITCGYGTTTPCRWHVWLGTGSTFVESGVVPIVPGGPYSASLCVQKQPPVAIDLDANGDGITERVMIGGGTLDAQPWNAVLSAGLVPGPFLPWGIGPSIGSSPYYPTKVWCEYESGTRAQVQVPDESKFYGEIADLNGDGRADGVFRNAIRWNSGRVFGAAQTYSAPTALWPRMWRTRIWGSWGTSCFYDVGLYGDDGMYQDLNGDGIPDYLHVDYSLSALSPTWRLYKGVLRTGSSGSLDGGREILLRT